MKQQIISKENFQSQCPQDQVSPILEINANDEIQYFTDDWFIGWYNIFVLTIAEVITTSPFMLITSGQVNGNILQINVQLGTDSPPITNIWLASQNHSDCTYCGTLLNNSSYQTTWIGEDKNYFWSNPISVITNENFQSQCPPKNNSMFYLKFNEDQSFPFNNILSGTWANNILTILENNEPTVPSMFITEGQANRSKLTIKVNVSIGNSNTPITNMWLASQNHSDCTYCGTLLNNSTYQVTWIGNNGNYFWSNPILVPPSTLSSSMISQEKYSSCPSHSNQSLLIVILFLVLILLILFVVFMFHSQK